MKKTSRPYGISKHNDEVTDPEGKVITRRIHLNNGRSFFVCLTTTGQWITYAFKYRDSDVRLEFIHGNKGDPACHHPETPAEEIAAILLGEDRR